MTTCLLENNKMNQFVFSVAECSEGEEAYSIAIIVAEYLEALTVKKKPKLQIFAADLDCRAIATAILSSEIL